MADKKANSTRKTKKDQLVELLRDAIISGELEPGTRLLQEQLAERFDVSPTPVREAIQQLIAEGVLRHSPYKGVQVAEVDLETVRETYLIRAVVENLATRLAVPNLKVSDIQRLHGIQQEMMAAVRQSDVSAVHKLNIEFHMLIYNVADAPQLLQIIKNLWAKSPWDTLHVVPGRPAMVIQEHQLVIEAIDKANPKLAGQHMQAHIEHGQTALVSYLSHPKANQRSPKVLS